jgi:hypothetical protein
MAFRMDLCTLLPQIGMLYFSITSFCKSNGECYVGRHQENSVRCQKKWVDSCSYYQMVPSLASNLGLQNSSGFAKIW